MNILALDCSGRTVGFASRWKGHLDCGSKEFNVQRGESPGVAWLAFRRWLWQMGSLGFDGEPAYDLIVYEQAHHRGAAATHVSETLIGIVEEFCARYPTEHKAVHTGTLKRDITGKGNADKAAMMAEAARRYPGQDVSDEHVGDALCLLAWAEEQYGEAEAAAQAREERT